MIIAQTMPQIPEVFGPGLSSSFGATEPPRPSTLLWSVLGVTVAIGGAIWLLAPPKKPRRRRNPYA